MRRSKKMRLCPPTGLKHVGEKSTVDSVENDAVAGETVGFLLFLQPFIALPRSKIFVFLNRLRRY